MRRLIADFRQRLEAAHSEQPHFGKVKALLLASFTLVLLFFFLLNIVKQFWLQPPYYLQRATANVAVWLALLLTTRLVLRGRLVAAGNALSIGLIVPVNFVLVLPHVPIEPVGTAFSMFAYGILGLLITLVFATRPVAFALLLVQLAGQVGTYYWGLRVRPLPGSLEHASGALIRDGLAATCLIFFLGLLVLHMLENAQGRSEEALRATRVLNQNLEQLVLERTQKLQELNDEKDIFLGIAAHDLRNPAAKIRMIAEAVEVEGDYSEARLRGAIAAVSETAARQLELLDELLDVSAIEGGKTTLVLVPLDLREILRQVHADFSPRALAKGVTLVLEELSAEALLAQLDAHAIRQVLDNLVSNALKFSASGRRVWLAAAPLPGGMAGVSVRDEGPGLSAADRAKLFGKFTRLSARPTAGERSTGLGLYIVKRLVDCMAGTITVDSEPGRGATFRVAVPAA